jgi:hypothetical protein
MLSGFYRQQYNFDYENKNCVKRENLSDIITDECFRSVQFCK